MDENHLPLINICNDLTGMLLSMLKLQILIDPGDQVVLERSLNQLMEKIWGDKFMDVSAGKVHSKRLSEYSKLGWTEKNEHTQAPKYC